jgi:Malectin domain
MALTHPPLGTKEEMEWQELQALLQSGILEKAPNLRHFLEYVAEQYFAGKTEEVKEYSIAVQALHRHEQFDPQSDTIVRVTAHTLRKKLEQYYATEGADHPIQIRLPAGKYLLQFERKEKPFALPPGFPETPLPVEALLDTPPHRTRPVGANWAALAVAAVAVLLLLGSILSMRKQAPPKLQSILSGAQPNDDRAPAQSAMAVQDRAIRFQFGAASQPYIDAAGRTWLTDRYCKGGSTFSHPNREIQGTDDPALLQQGREGKFQCRIPARPGNYQLQLLFADTTGDKEGARQVDVSINNTPIAALDIVDEGGGDDVMVGKVYTGIRPTTDGTIHLDFTSDASFVNAAELTPSPSERGLPLRMLAGPAVIRDDQGTIWQPEQFFLGGRRTSHIDGLPKVANPRLYEWERYGHFRYLIPVVANQEYKVKLYFSEQWFGKTNGGSGGVGSRVFDVYCNGTTLLKDFDILKQPGDGTMVVTFDHVKPTAHNMLELYFTPVTNYPLINALEIEPES